MTAQVGGRLAIPRRGSKPITVDGERYRWYVRRRPTYAQGNAWGTLILAVQREEMGGAVLLVHLLQCHPSNWMLEPVMPVLPGQVAGWIQRALAAGWHPREADGPFLFDGAPILGTTAGTA